MSLFFGAETENLESANACLMGLCWDKSSSFRRGSAKAPTMIRKYTSSKLYNSFTEAGLNITKHWRIHDMGDRYPQSIADIVSTVDKVIGSQSDIELNIFLGGDHSITYGTLKALKESTQSQWGLVYFDAHPDLHDIYEGDPYSHACTARRLVDEGIVYPENLVEIGIRAATDKDRDYMKRQDILVESTADIYNRGSFAIASNITKTLRDIDNVYLSFDVDVLDPAFAPGVGNPEGGGLTIRTLIEIIQSIRGLKIRAFDIVEANADYDCVGITFYSISKLLRELLGIACVS